MTDIAVFFCQETGHADLYLRRFCKGDGSPCRYHSAVSLEAVQRVDYPAGEALDTTRFKVSESDPRWPERCDTCGQPFPEDAEYQAFPCRVYERSDTSQEVVARGPYSLPVGAVSDCWWYPAKGPDGRSLCCITPGGPWMIDARASNCALPDDHAHRCWVRHGSPEDGSLHVDKNGLTCAAGAGSIAAGSYHGFLHHGRLTDC